VSTPRLPGSAASTAWPATARWGDDGLEIGGVAAATLAERFSTPLLVFDVVHLRRRCREVRRAFPQVHYAVKALTARTLLQLADCEGLRVLAASRGELEACLRAGLPPAHIALHGNNKSDAELERAIGAGIGLLICDNAGEIARAGRVATALRRRQDVLVRVVPDVTAGAHRYLATGVASSKFGVPIESGEAAAAVRSVVDADGLRYRGLHAHIGSQVLDAEPYLATADRLVVFAGRLARESGIDTELVDIGGGFGIVYVDEQAPDIGLLAHALHARVAETAAREGIPAPRLLAEPGRALVGNAGVTLYRVGAVKRAADGAPVVAVDGGMSDNPRPMLYGSRYEVAHAAPAVPGSLVPATVVGQHCEAGDVVAAGVPLVADIEAGELLAVAATGAYCYSMASNYNRTPRPAVVAVEQGDARLWLRRETHDDLDRLEVAAARSA
jgi:diaminopimelate decarboxylase